MGEVIRLAGRLHAGAPVDTGLSTDAGQAASSGHRSENQPITSSYLRAVKVFSLSSSLSKKRQSPAARRPSVAKLTERDAAYADAHAMRFERSSVSIASNGSRKIPTLQEPSVGNFRLADAPEKSDKSAMPSVDQIRQTIRRAMDRAGEGAVTLAGHLDQERNYVRDFLAGDKSSMKTEVMLAISERYDIPFKDLIITKAKALRKSA